MDKFEKIEHQVLHNGSSDPVGYWIGHEASLLVP